MKGFNPEISFEENPFQLSEAERKLHDLLVPKNEEQRIEIDAFEGLYGKDVIARDMEEVARLEKIFENDKQQNPQMKVWGERGALFEAIINDQIQASNWLGENASVIVPSRYDDIKNGIDGVIEFQKESGKSHLALAVDITKSSRELDNKLDRIRSSIDTGQLSRMKYFESPDMRGELRELPRVVVGADQDTIREITDLLLTFKTRQKFPDAGKRGEFKTVRGQLEHHRLQFLVLFEIKEQLEKFKEYALGVGQPAIAQKYEQTSAMIDGILKDKEHEYAFSKDHPDFQRDEVYSLILDKVKSF